MKKLTISIEIEMPEGTTHWSGYLGEATAFYKCVNFGVVGEHWFFYGRNERGEGPAWYLIGHSRPYYVMDLPNQ